MAKKFLTLNIGAATVELAEYEADSKGALTLLNYGTAHLAAPLDAGNAGTILSPALLEIVREKGIRPGPVAVSISGQMAFQRFAAIPMAGGTEKFEQMVRYDLEERRRQDRLGIPRIERRRQMRRAVVEERQGALRVRLVLGELDRRRPDVQC